MTIKEPDNVPLDIEQLEKLTTLPVNEQLESLEEKLEPETWTVVPVGPEVGLSVIDRGLVTVKVADVKSPSGLPVAVIVYEPGATSAMVKEPVNVPPETEQDPGEATELPDKLQEVSLEEKSDPDTWTSDPACAEAGLNVIDMALLLTTKVAEAESSLGLPVAVIVYVPDAVEATVNDADKVPSEMEQLKVSTGLPDNEQLVSVVEKSDPVTSTVDPTKAEAELSVIDGDAPLTVKLAEAESLPGLPLAVIVYVPDATSATTNDAYKVPSEMEQLKVSTGLPDNEQLVSAVEKPDPVTSTDAPTEAEVELSVIDGGTALTVKLADAESPA